MERRRGPSVSTGPGGKKPGTGKRDGKDVVSKEEKKKQERVAFEVQERKRIST